MGCCFNGAALRAIYLNKYHIQGEEIFLEGDEAHHLINVLRIKNGEKVLGLDGEGGKYFLQIDMIKKKSLSLILLGKEFIASEYSFTLLVGKVKKEAMDLSLKVACELGINTILVAQTQYSQSYPLNFKRMQRVLVSALEQSNNAYLPQVKEVVLDEVDYKSYEQIIYFSSRKNVQKNEISLSQKKKVLLVIGPEGGFSEKEELIFTNKKNATAVHLPTNIMRTPTAIACGHGYYLGALS